MKRSELKLIIKEIFEEEKDNYTFTQGKYPNDRTKLDDYNWSEDKFDWKAINKAAKADTNMDTLVKYYLNWYKVESLDQIPLKDQSLIHQTLTSELNAKGMDEIDKAYMTSKKKNDMYPRNIRPRP